MANGFFGSIAACLFSGDFKKFQKATLNPDQEQERVMRRALDLNRDTAFGKEFSFSQIRTYDDFRRLPITDFDFISPWIDKEAKGEGNQLTSEKVTAFVRTSGTTGKPKLIPVTKSYLKSQQLLQKIWFGSAAKDHPGILGGKTLPIVSQMSINHTEAGIPYGSGSALMGEKGIGILTRIFGIDCKYYLSQKSGAEMFYRMAEISVANRNLRQIMAGSPARVLQLCKAIESNPERLVKDVALRSPKRAKELEELIRENRFTPEFIWPNFSLIGCWKGGTQYLFLDRLPQYFGNTPVRDLGLTASEAVMSVPVRDSGSAGALSINEVFFEFIPRDQIGSKNPEVLTIKQLRKGEEYFILLTTDSGMCRYNIFDLVKVGEMYNKTPEIEFLNKGKNMSSIVGERLSERQVVDAYRDSRREGMDDTFALYPEVLNGRAVQYTLASLSEPNPDFVRRFDSALRKANITYHLVRNSGLVLPPKMRKVSLNELNALTGQQDNSEMDAKQRYLVSLESLNSLNAQQKQ